MTKKTLLLALILIFSMSTLIHAVTHNLLALEPLGLFNNTFSGYYSKISLQTGTQVTFPLFYQEKTGVNILNVGALYRKYFQAYTSGFYFEAKGHLELRDYVGPDTLILDPSIMLGYRIDTGQGFFVEPELCFSLPLISKGGSNFEVSEIIDSSFNITLGLDNYYPNGMFFAPRLVFDYFQNTLGSKGLLYLGYQF